jgi:hypothetical protein
MVCTERVTWLTLFGLFAATMAATLWKRAVDAERAMRAYEHDLMRMDSDMG